MGFLLAGLFGDVYDTPEAFEEENVMFKWEELFICIFLMTSIISTLAWVVIGVTLVGRMMWP